MGNVAVLTNHRAAVYDNPAKVTEVKARAYFCAVFDVEAVFEFELFIFSQRPVKKRSCINRPARQIVALSQPVGEPKARDVFLGPFKRRL